jgi:hypothetical protein
MTACFPSKPLETRHQQRRSMRGCLEGDRARYPIYETSSSAIDACAGATGIGNFSKRFGKFTGR